MPPDSMHELKEWVREIKEALGQQFSGVHRELSNLDDKVTDSVSMMRDLEERVRHLEIKDARRDGKNGQDGGSDLTVNYKLIGAIISGAVGGLYVLFDLITKHGGK